MKKRKDSIVLSGMAFYAYHGVLPEEKKLGQKFLVNVELFLELNKPGKTDDLVDTVDYAAIYEVIKGIMEGPSHQLLESLAEEIAAKVLKFPIKGIIVEVKKISPPIPGFLESVAVKINRGEIE
ncbi:MAG: dihydroneopterin aldolase [Dethiobacteria bacterium]|jgi:dihydroneopterin aldolase